MNAERDERLRRDPDPHLLAARIRAAGAPIYSAADAERAWGKLLALHRSALA